MEDSLALQDDINSLECWSKDWLLRFGIYSEFNRRICIRFTKTMPDDLRKQEKTIELCYQVQQQSH